MKMLGPLENRWMGGLKYDRNLLFAFEFCVLLVLLPFFRFAVLFDPFLPWISVFENEIEDLEFY